MLDELTDDLYQTKGGLSDNEAMWELLRMGKDGSWKQTFSGRELDGCTAVCPAGSKVYFGAAGSASLLSARV